MIFGLAVRLSCSARRIKATWSDVPIRHAELHHLRRHAIVAAHVPAFERSSSHRRPVVHPSITSMTTYGRPHPVTCTQIRQIHIRINLDAFPLERLYTSSAPISNDLGDGVPVSECRV
jgi:hypothetical protein